MEIIIAIVVILLLFLLCLLFVHGAEDKSREELGDEEQMKALSGSRWKEENTSKEESV